MADLDIPLHQAEYLQCRQADGGLLINLIRVRAAGGWLYFQATDDGSAGTFVPDQPRVSLRG